jgi:hypothetical protein
MERILKRLLLPALAALAGYWPQASVSQDARTLAPPPPDKARIIFIRPRQAIGRNSTAALMEVLDGRRALISQLAPNEKTVFETAPGKKEFMTVAYSKGPTGGFITGRGDLLFADVLGGKTYYVMLTYKTPAERFLPTPVRANQRYHADSNITVRGLETYRVVGLAQGEAERFAREHNGEILEKEYRNVSGIFDKKNLKRMAGHTLGTEDFVD